MIPTPQVRSRVALAALALAGYAACGDTPPEPQHTAYSDQPKLDYARPESIEKPEDYDVRIKLVARATRSTPKRTTIDPPKAAASDCTLDDIKRRESGGNYEAVSASGKYRGAYQFDRATFRGAVSRAGHPEYADTPVDQVPPGVQDAAARQLYAERGTQPWSVCR